MVTASLNHYFHSSPLARLCWTYESSKTVKTVASSWGNPREVGMPDAWISSFLILGEAESWDFFHLLILC